jgi:hypothetical protein
MKRKKRRAKRAIRIDARNGVIEHYENTGLKSLQDAVEGYIEVGHRLKNGDILIVNEEGLLREFDYGFSLSGYSFLGSGVIVGPTDHNGHDRNVQTSIDDLKEVQFSLISKQLQTPDNSCEICIEEAQHERQLKEAPFRERWEGKIKNDLDDARLSLSQDLKDSILRYLIREITNASICDECGCKLNSF